MYILYSFFGLIFLGGIWAIFSKIRENNLFKAGHNPYARICKKCGAHQNLYQSNIEGCDHHTWWE